MEAHIKWLSKTKTVVINGDEMTVLPYGYLQTAIKEALGDQMKKVIEILNKEKQPLAGSDWKTRDFYVYGLARDDFKDDLKKAGLI